MLIVVHLEHMSMNNKEFVLLKTAMYTFHKQLCFHGLNQIENYYPKIVASNLVDKNNFRQKFQLSVTKSGPSLQ